MANIVITNLTTSPIYLRDFYTTIGPSTNTNTAVGPAATLTFASNVSGNTALTGGSNKALRSPADVMRMYQIQSLLAAGSITVSVVADANEIASGFGGQAESVGLQDIVVARATFTAAANPTEVVLFANNTMPFKARMVDAWLSVSTAAASSIVAFFTATAGSGRISGDISGAAVGIVRAGANQPAPAGTLITPSSTVGLFARVSGAANLTADAYCMLRRE